jgi:putative ubiquitin-RnfH superfamily antitoxin RatB of RatAB toxin-antitoxin module
VDDLIEVSVAYALPHDSFWQNMTVPLGTTASQAIELSGVLERFSELDIEELSIGIYALPAKLNKVLADGDRVEIYRPLLVDPKTVPKKAKPKKATG